MVELVWYWRGGYTCGIMEAAESVAYFHFSAIAFFFFFFSFPFPSFL